MPRAACRPCVAGRRPGRRLRPADARAAACDDEADAIVYDAWCATIVDMGPPTRERLRVGKRKGCHSQIAGRDNQLLVSLPAKQARRPLKIRRPLVYGRAARKWPALRDARASATRWCGVTSALQRRRFRTAADVRAAWRRRWFSRRARLTGSVLPDWARLAVSGATIAVYMGPYRCGFRRLAAHAGRSAAGHDRRCHRECGAVPSARLLHGTLRDLRTSGPHGIWTGRFMVIIGEASRARISNAPSRLRPAASSIAVPANFQRNAPNRFGTEDDAMVEKVLTANRLADGIPSGSTLPATGGVVAGCLRRSPCGGPSRPGGDRKALVRREIKW